MDLLEEIFNIPETQVPSKKGKGRQPGPAEDLDPTMANSTKDITIMERYLPPVIRDPKMPEPEANDVYEFGADEGFDFSFVRELAEHPIHPLDSPALLREAQETNELEVLNFPEASFSYDVMEAVNTPKASREHRSAYDGSFSQQHLESSLKELGVEDSEEDSEAQDINNNSGICEQPDLSSLNFDANDAEVIKALAAADESEDPSLKLIELSPAKTVRKQKKKNTKLIVDNQTMISSEVIKKNMEKYEEKFTVEMPMETFMMRWNCIKREHTNLLALPSSRLKKGAKLLLPIYERNLKRISMAMLKRPRMEIDADQPVEPPPKKKRATRKNSLVVATEESPIKEAPQQPVIESVLQLEPIIDYELPELADFDLMPLIQTPEKKRDQRKEVNHDEYDAGWVY